MRYLSVCSGMEAASVAWHPLGWTPVGFSEIEPFPCAILKHRFPNTPNYGSLTEYQSWPIEPGAIDLLVGGTPCQSFSVAGLRKGLADPRGNLALTFLGLADKLKPRWIVWENVPGVLSSGGGRDFGSFLGALVELGYGFAYRILDAQHFGVPQRRRRVFVVACLGDWRAAAEVLSLREGLRGYIETGNKKRKGPAADAGASAEAGCWWDGGQVSQTLDAVLAKGQTMPEKNRFPAVLQPIVIDRAAFNQGENAQYEPHIGESEVMDSLVARGPHAVGVPFRKSKRACSTTDNETWVPADASNTLNNFDLGDTRTTHAVVEPQVYENHPNDSRITGPLDVAPTVVSRFGTGGGNVPLVNNEAITFQPGNLRREAGADPSFTTTTTTLKASAGDQTPHVAIPPMAVRRLTPNECYRLQGFPDNWGNIPWKGKPEGQAPDGPQYKAAGNSMAVPVMRWIGERIAAVDSTLSSNA
jgi:DNA (cytosine-5)-methyltransferase 1